MAGGSVFHRLYNSPMGSPNSPIWCICTPRAELSVPGVSASHDCTCQKYIIVPSPNMLDCFTPISL